MKGGGQGFEGPSFHSPRSTFFFFSSPCRLFSFSPPCRRRDKKKGVHAQRPEPTRGFKLQQTMLRIKDPERSLAFYTGVLGMRLSATLAFEAQRFSLYFLEFSSTALPADEGDRLEDVFSGRSSFLELTHNHGERKSLSSFSFLCKGVTERQSSGCAEEKT